MANYIFENFNAALANLSKRENDESEPKIKPEIYKQAPIKWKSLIDVDDVEEIPFKCKECDKCCEDQHSLRKHVITHRDEELFFCSICTDSSFKSLDEFKSHVEIHSGNRFRCRRCYKRFVRSDKFFKHLETHIGAELYHCRLCDSFFSNKDALKRHKEQHLSKLHNINPSEPGSAIIACLICKKAFTQKYYLDEHLPMHITNIKNSCSECGIRFTQQLDLVKHMSIHQNKLIGCKDCFKTFKQADFATHTCTISNRKLFPCSSCEKSFDDIGILDKHTLVHFLKSTAHYYKRNFGNFGNIL